MALSLEPIVHVNDPTLRSRELREKYNSYINTDPALIESRRWIEEVTRREFKSDDFRESLADGIFLCELIEIVGDISLGRINRLPTAYAGIDNLNLFFKACERLGLKRLQVFDTTDLQEVTSRRGDSTSSRAKETQRRLQNVAITILWLAKAARKQGFQGPPLDASCFDHLLPEAHLHGKKERGTRKRHSLGDLETKSRVTEHIPPKKRDRVFDKIDIKDRKEKFRNLEKEAKQESAALDSNRRRSTGGILKRKEKTWFEEERVHNHKDKKQLKSKMPDPKFHEKKELFNRRDQLDSASDKSHRKESGSSDRVTSPPPISLGKKVEVDLKEKQKKFEGLDKNAEEQSAVLRGKARPVSWGPGEIRQALKKQSPVDIAFKEKHQNYEQLQRQATTESAVLQGKLRPQPERDGKPEKVPLTGRSDVKLREKQKDFEQRDYQAQREKAVLEGNLRLSAIDGKGKRPGPVMVPKREQVKLDEKKAAFEQLDRQAEQDASILRGQHRPPVTDMDGRKRSSKVGLPRDANVGLLEKQRTFEDRDYQARKESEILQKNKRKSFGSPVKEPMPLSTSTRPQVARFQSPSDRQWDTSDVIRRNQQERPSRPVSNYYEYSSLNDVPKRASGEGIVQGSAEEPMESAPLLGDERVSYRQNQRDLPAEQNIPNHDDRAAEDKRGEYSDYVRRRYEESRRRKSSGEEPLDINLSDAKNLAYRDLVRAPLKKSRDTFIRENNYAAPVEEMPWRKEVREVKDKRHLLSDEERDTSYAARPSSPCSELGKAQYLELVVPPSKRAMDSFAKDGEGVGEKSEEMPWRKEVKEIRRSPSAEEPPAFPSFEQRPETEVIRIRPPSLKTRDVFVTQKDDKDEEEMPWRREVRELKERPRTEDEHEYEDENPPPEVESSTGPNLRKLSYKEFINVPSRKRRDVFQPGVEKDREEMPWRKEVREIKRSSTDEEEEQFQKSSVTLAQSAPDQDYTRPAYNDIVAKPSRKARDHFVAYQGKEKEEMPWRKEVREIKRTVTEDEPVQRSYATNIHSSPEDPRDYRKFSYQDFVARPRKKSVERFLPSEKEEKEEMPWRKEVRELRYRPSEEEQINQTSRSELQSAPDDSFQKSFERPSKWITENGRETNRNDDKREASRNGPYPVRPSGVQNLSYKDFICPPSKASEQQSQTQRKNKVKDITKRFTELEAEKDRPKGNGPPARKSLVDVAELKRIERDMRTKSWHGFPDDYDSDDDYDTARRRRIRSEEEDEEERLRQQYNREKASGTEELDDVFQDPEGYFDQIQGPPLETFKQDVVEEAPVQYEAPSWNEHDDRRVQVVTVRSANDNDLYRPHDQHGQPSSYSTYSDDHFDERSVREEFLPKRKPSDDRVVVKQTWIQPNRVELAEASPNVPEHEQQRNTNQEFIPSDNGPFVPQYYRDERPHLREYPKSEPFEPKRDYRREDDSYPKGIDPNEEKCFIGQSEYPQENQPYYPGSSSYREPSQVHNGHDDWEPRDMRHDPGQHLRNEPTKMPVKDDRTMVFGAPIMITAKPRTQQSTKHEGLRDRVQEQSGSYDFFPAEERSFNSRNGIKSKQDYRDISQTEERSYYNRNGIKSMQDEREKIENARGLVLQDIRSLGKKDAIEPPEEPRIPSRPQVFGVFARTDTKEMPKHEHIENSFQENRYNDRRKRDVNKQGDLQDWTANKEHEESDSMYMEARLEEHDDKGYDYENSVTNHTELHPMVVSTVESQTRQWGDGVFDTSPQKDEQRTGRGRVMNFSDDLEYQMPDGDKKWSANLIGNDNVYQTKSEPVQKEVDRRREQKEKEDMVKENLRDAEYREKYRREFEEKNRKQQEKTKYLMSLQMRASLDPDEDYDKEEEKPRDIERKEGNEIPRATDRLSDEDLVKAVAAEEDYWHKTKEKKTERESREVSRHERPRRINSDDSQTRINGIDFVSEEDVVRKEKKAFDQEERIRKLKAEEEFMAQEAERLMRERGALKQRAQAEEPIIAPVEKPPVEFSINEDIFNDFLAEGKRDKDFYDENRNHNTSSTRISGQRDGYYNGEEYKPLRELELRENERQYSDSISKPQAEVLPLNGHRYESDVYPKAPAEILKENGDHFHQDDFPGNAYAAPEANGFEGYSIYETFIHGESNHVICTSCGTSIEKSPSMYIAELDRYWHVNCFCCVVCRAWFGDEFSPVLHITNSMLHCERCYITDEGERCTEV